MSEDVFRELQKMLDSIPNGFPATESGVEIKILKRIFTEDEAKLFMKLRMRMEPVTKIAKRIGMDEAVLKQRLKLMRQKGQIFGIDAGDQSYYRIMPYVIGIYELQLRHMDRGMAELFDEYTSTALRRELFRHTPAMMKVVPIGIDVPHEGVVEPYESAVKLVEEAKSWAVSECICKKEKALLGHRCDKPMEVCLTMSPIESTHEDRGFGRQISKEEALRILAIAEEAGLVHMVSNYRKGHYYICNCCSCCCGVLMGLNMTSRNAVAKSNYYAVIDADKCTACGICVDRCQANAVTVNDYAEIGDCIGCGLCVSTCPSGAISMVKREEAEIPPIPKNEFRWLEERARARGMDDGFKRLFSDD